MRRDLKKKRILITGGSRGIGKNIAELLVQYESHLMLVGRSAVDLERVSQELRSRGGTVYYSVGDLTNSADRERVIRETIDKLGGLDVLINNAGVTSFGEFSSSSSEILRKIMEINFFAPVELIRLALPYLAESSHQPVVMNIASICGRRGIPSFPEHCASKFALVGLTEALRGELKRFGVDVLLVLPGIVKVENREKHFLRNEGRIYLDWENAQTPERVARSIVRSLRWNWTESVVGWVALQVHRGQRVFPALIEWIMKRKVRKFEERALALSTKPLKP